MSKKNIPVYGLILAALISCGKTQEGAGKPQIDSPDPAVPSLNVIPEIPIIPNQAALSPLQSIKELDKKIESYKTGKNLTPEDLEYNRLLKEQIIRGTFDLEELCRLSLDVHWEPLSEKDRVHFVKLMSNLLEKKAIFSKEQVKNTNKPYNIVYKGEKFLDPQKKQSLVSTTVYVPSEKIDLNINYKLNKTDRGYRIFDVIVDDASLVDNYKFQFDTIIRKNGYPDLITRMQKKLESIK